MINKLQADSGAKIQVAPDGSEINGERQVSISGSPDTVEKAKMLVNAVIEEAGGVTSVAMVRFIIIEGLIYGFERDGSYGSWM
jgi:far upstream element-binding protein